MQRVTLENLKVYETPVVRIPKRLAAERGAWNPGTFLHTGLSR